MSRFAISGRMAAVPTAARGPSVYATTLIRPQIREIGIFNTTSVACAIGVGRASAVGTKGAAITPVPESDFVRVAVATGAQTHTADATINAVLDKQASLGAAIGSGVIWTWGPGEFILENATTSGVVIVCPTGTGQICDFYIAWDE